jgi:hypothetical protein
VVVGSSERLWIGGRDVIMLEGVFDLEFTDGSSEWRRGGSDVV